VNGNDASNTNTSYVQTLCSIRDSSDIEHWAVINDGVMGGRSQSTLKALPAGAIFSGTVSAENGGGFASVRTTLSNPTAPAGRAISVRVRGDGKIYQFRIRTDPRRDAPAYKYAFTTEPGVWKELVMPLGEFQASFRGRSVADAAELESAAIQQVGFLIAEKQFGAFKLEFDDIKLV
jgi:monofunctional biosynthetic peptidoglycan transglycosylase